MASNGQTSYACKCLNVRIHPSPPPAASEPAADPDFLQIYAGDEGLLVAHPQLTLRSKGPRLDRSHENSRQCIRHVSLTCLVCQTLVYRVVQTVSPDGETGEGLVLPTEEWAENEVLKSISGWVEVSKHCLSGHQISEAEASPLYSSSFCIILPSGVSSPPSATPLYVVPSPSPTNSLHETLRTILPPLPALFPPPPFTPAHAVFTHLSAAATSESERLRRAAEDDLQALVAQKVAELQASEEKLKHEVELIWLSFRSSMDKYEAEPTHSRRIPLNRRRSGSKSGPQPSQPGIPSSVRVVDFLPASVTPSRVLSPSSIVYPGVSALSASMATSTIHQAMAQAHAQSEQGVVDSPRRSGRSVSPARSGGMSSVTRRAVSPSTASTRTLAMPINGEAEIRDAYRRNMNESLDTATSFKYMMDIGAHMEASGIPTQPDIPEETEVPVSPPSPHTSIAVRGRSSPRAGKSAIKKPAKSRETTPHKVAGSPVHADGDISKEQTTPKGKRKVTFDVKPDVAIIDEPSSAETTPLPPREEEPVFDMDNEILGDGTDALVPVALPLNQPSTQEFTYARRPSRFRPVNMSGLPSSLSTLRPASLPLPSAMPVRPFAAPQPTDERARVQSVREALLSGIAEGENKRLIMDEIREEPEDEVNEREAEILKLVAASMPSHRSAWKRDSSAWQTFVNRRRTSEVAKAAASEDDDTSNGESAAYYDESEDESEEEPKDHWSGENFSKSLPIPIGPLGSRKGGLPSVLPKASLPEDRPAAPPPVDKVSTATLRRASYAERDRHRPLDPGVLDFAGEDDDEEDDEDRTEGVDERSRQLALKILQKRSQLPADGLWRSLA